MSKHSLEDRVRAIAESAANESDLELVHSEIAGRGPSATVRVFIDKKAGVTHEDCAAVSLKISAAMDSEDLLTSAYILEVSSPGLERGLYSPEDFAKFSGRSAKIRTQRAIDGQKHYTGKIVGIDAGEIIFDDKSRGAVRIPFGAVAKANLEIDFEEELKRIRK